MKTKENIIAALHAFISQRSGIDYAEYGERESFMGDYKQVLKHGKDARAMLRRVELSAMTAETILASVGNGRLQIEERDGKLVADYTVGQYFPTEYRSAVCRLLASSLWSYWREIANPVADCEKTYQSGIVDASAYIRKTAKRELGRGIAKRWFN